MEDKMQLFVREKWYPVYLIVNKYSYDKSLAIDIVSNELGPIVTLTVNLLRSCKRTLLPNQAFVNSIKYPWLITLIEKYQLGKQTKITCTDKGITYPLYKFNPKELNKYTKR